MNYISLLKQGVILMKKIDVFNIIEKKLKDLTGEFVVKLKVASIASTTVTLVEDANLNSMTEQLFAGDTIVVKDGITAAKFFTITQVINATQFVVSSAAITAYISGASVTKYDFDMYVDDALKTYNRFRPLQKAATLSLVNGYSVLPNDWQNNFSTIINVFNPATSSVPVGTSYSYGLNSSNALSIYYDINRSYPTSFLNSSSRMIYSVMHVWDITAGADPVTTVEDQDIHCLADIATSFIMVAKAAERGDSIRTTDASAIVNYEGKVSQFIKLSHIYLEKAASWLGVDVEEMRKGKQISEPFSSSTPLYDAGKFPLINSYS